MITAEIQIHGYRKGHQLIASSVALHKDDQALVDRLSDVAGPLRPKEQFAPYLSAYPLPSGSFYVVARTWQDLSVARAGCVMTKSVLIDAQTWSWRPPLIQILQLIASPNLPSEDDAVRISLSEKIDDAFPPATIFNASELLEALFLEDVKPVVLFDAPEPEVIAVRLLAALWPDIRRRFALSTFALAPRKIGGRDLDLVFAPSNAKAKFSDWPGRRVDGRSPQGDRHRWTGSIVSRVFEAPVPKLLSEAEINLLGDREADSAAALRIALLWNELLEKLDRTPTVALGLLDIANSGMVSQMVAVQILEHRLAEATRNAGSSLSANDAWDFVGAMARKMQGHDMPLGIAAVEELASVLSERSPVGAVSLLRQPDPDCALNTLVHSIALGLAGSAAPDMEQTLVEAPADIIARLVAEGSMLARRVAESDRLIKRMGEVLTEVDQQLADKAGMTLLPFLVEDRHLAAARPIVSTLDSVQIADEIRWLGDVNEFNSKRLCAELIERAREVCGLQVVRDVLLSFESSASRNNLIDHTVYPIVADLLWLVDEKRLGEAEIDGLLVAVLRRADRQQLVALLSDQRIGEEIGRCLPDEAVDLLADTIVNGPLPANAFARVLRFVIPRVDESRKFEIAAHALGICLRRRFEGDESAVLEMLLEIVGGRLDGRWAVRVGLERGIETEVAIRNLIVFERAPSSAREHVVQAVDEVARAIQGRRPLDLNEPAYDACARIMFDAEKAAPKELHDAANWLMPSLLRAGRQPVSLLVAALFPMNYRELISADNSPSIFKLVSLFDLDRGRIARSELVNTFMASSWRAGDLALTALRCGDIERILKQVATSYGGGAYLARIESDLGRLEQKHQYQVVRKINEIRSGKSQKGV